MALARLAALCFLIVLPLAPALAQETPEDYPSGPGRETTFYASTPCHGFQIVAQQGQTRAQWENMGGLPTER